MPERIELATRGLDCPTSIPNSSNQAGFLALAAPLIRLARVPTPAES